MKRHRGKSWHTLYKEALLKGEEINRHLRTLQQKYISVKEEIINLEQAIADIHLRHKKQMDAEHTEHTKTILLMRLRHAEQLKEIRIELSALQIELQRVKVKDDIARTTEGLIAQCVRILADYAQGKKPGDEEAAPIGKALGELKANYHREEALRKQAVENAVRRVGHPHTATDMNRAMYGLGPAEQVHISEMGKWPEADPAPYRHPRGTWPFDREDLQSEDPLDKVGIGKVPSVDIHVREDEPEQPLAPADFAPENTRPDPKGS
jgi:hypothetical protein